MYGHGVNRGLLETCKGVFKFNAYCSRSRWLFLCVCFQFMYTLWRFLFFVVYFYRKQISVPVRVQGLEAVRVIAVGAFHNLALQEDGTLWAWGNNEYGQLGTGDTQPRSQPIPVQGLSGLTLVCIISCKMLCCFHLLVKLPHFLLKHWSLEKWLSSSQC